MPAPGWHALEPSGRSWGRRAASDRTREERGYLARLVERLPGTEAHDAGTAAYLDLLDRALEDRRVTQTEAEELMRIAGEWQLSRADIQEAHREYLAGLTNVARADGSVSAAERADLEAVRDMLGLHATALEALLTGPTSSPTNADARSAKDELGGRTVCFTGELRGRLDGRLISREQAEELARQAGLRPVSRVTRELDILVVADPDTMSSKAKEARVRGVRILAEPVFWTEIGVRVE
jgi:DNA polymerase III subunit epsilon